MSLDVYTYVYFTVWSIAEHGPTQLLVEKLRPLLIKYKVTGYISGHDHNMQHLREKNQSLEYFVIGAGHDTNPSVAHMVSYKSHAIWHALSSCCFLL